MAFQQGYPLPEMPGVCLTCGARAPLTLTAVFYRYTSKASLLGTVLLLFVGFVFFRQKVYRLQLPLCGACSGYVKLAKAMTVACWLLSLPAFLLLFKFSLDHEHESPMLGGFVFIAVAYVVCAATRRRGTPKKVRVDNDRLVIHVPGYGDFDLLDCSRRPERRYYASQHDAPQHEAPPRPDAPAGARLNRSVCAGCGFINFAGAVECKKCRAFLGRTVAV